MNRNATLYKQSADGTKLFYIDDLNAKSILGFLASDKANAKKFKYVLELLLEHNHPPRDLYDKENIEAGCEHITAIKLFKGKKNPRIYCQQYTLQNKKVFVIIASELLVKKKSEGLTNKEKTIIRRVASYNYQLKNN